MCVCGYNSYPTVRRARLAGNIAPFMQQNCWRSISRVKAANCRTADERPYHRVESPPLILRLLSWKVPFFSYFHVNKTLEKEHPSSKIGYSCASFSELSLIRNSAATFRTGSLVVESHTFRCCLCFLVKLCLSSISHWFLFVLCLWIPPPISPSALFPTYYLSLSSL